MEKDVLKIIKVGNLKYMEPFLQTGEMYFDTVESFAKKDANQERYDQLEGAIELKQVNWIKLQAQNGKAFEFSKTNPKHIRISSAFLTTHVDTTVGNIYSCSAVTPDTIDSFKNIDPRFKNFGDTVVLIENPNEFTNRIIRELDKQELTYTMGLVNYYDLNNFNGTLTVFHKKDILSYQNELRILIHNDKKESIKIHISSITDIARKFCIEGLLKISK